MDTNDFINTTYHGAVIGGISVTYSILSKKLLKMKPPDLGKFDFEDGIKLAFITGSSLMTQKWLIKQGILPERIINN